MTTALNGGFDVFSVKVMAIETMTRAHRQHIVLAFVRGPGLQFRTLCVVEKVISPDSSEFRRGTQHSQYGRST